MSPFMRNHHFRPQHVSGPDVLHFGETPLHESEATGHFLFVGATGSGKTTVLRLLLQDVIPSIRLGADCRALVANPKQDMLPILRGMAAGVDIITLDPFDRRGYRWELCQDFTEVRTVVELSFTLFPSQHSKDPFFDSATRHITFGIIISFILSEMHWSLADLIRVLRSHDNISAVLKKHPYTAPIHDQYFPDPKLAANVMASIASRLLPFEPIAAAWEVASASISLSDWAQRACVIVLPHSEIGRAATDTINRCLVKRATDITLNQPDSFTRRVWYVFDEISDSPKYDGLVALLKKSRSKGGCVAVSFQSISGLRSAEKYGHEFTDEILGQVGNRFFGRLECPTTAEWASKLIGDQEVEGFTRSTSSGPNGSGSSLTRQVQMRRAVLPAELMMIEPCGIDTGLSAFFLTRSAGAFFAKLDAQRIFSSRLLPPADQPDFDPRPIQTQFLHIWTAQEASRFGIVSHVLEQASKSSDRTLNLADIDDLFK
ncbi:MAG: type IV secretory system conjugative DNA transfer family protein [Pirellulaceae bacterium]